MAKARIELKPNDRYTLIGKTGSGKTQFTTTLATTIVAEINEKTDGDPWHVWWCDTKGDPADIARLRKWGYVRVKRLVDNKPDGPELYRYFKLEPTDPNAENCSAEANLTAKAAYAHGRVLYVADEFVQVIQSSRRMGRPLQDLHQRGRGRMVGFMGQTQEPVDIPRQLISQATHLFIFNLTHQRDIDYVRNFHKDYVLPLEMGYEHGMWYRHIDGTTGWRFFKHERDFYEWIKGGGTRGD